MKLIAKMLFEGARRTPEFPGKHNILWHLVRKLPMVDEFQIQSGGAIFSIRGVEINEFWMAARGIHSPDIFKNMCELAGDDEVTVWDIGANIGTVSLPLLATKSRIKVVAFEPSPAVCAKLLKNANLNPALQSRLKIINCALSDKTGWVEFYASNEVNNSGIGGIGVASNRVSASFMTFAQLGSNCTELVSAPDIIKIDVEGHEISVLRGLGEILNKRPLTIIFEHSIYRLKENGTPFGATSDFLRDKGFKVSSLDGTEPVDLSKDQDLVASNAHP